jgi:hypothetical protein
MKNWPQWFHLTELGGVTSWPDIGRTSGAKRTDDCADNGDPDTQTGCRKNINYKCLTSNKKMFAWITITNINNCNYDHIVADGGE